MRRAVATAPGKLILIGEHAAVYGRPALVAALDLRTTVEAETRSAGIRLELETLGHRTRTDWAAIEAYTAGYAERWRRFDRRPTSDAWTRLADRDPARVVRLALGETRRALGRRPAAGLRLRVVSRIPVGSGFGSSASVAVAVAAALLALAGELAPGSETERGELLSRIALEVERRQHGRPSGVDHATVLRGGILRFTPGAEPAIRPLAARRPRLARLAVYDSGPPAESTGEVVAAVRALAEKDPTSFGRRLDAIERATDEFAAALAAPGDGGGWMIRAIRAGERRLEDLGVVPPAVRAAARRVERRGGAAKVSGAGALSGSAAGALLVCRPPGPGGDLDAVLAGYPCHRAAIGAPGLEIEEAG